MSCSASVDRRSPGPEMRVSLFITCFNDTLFPATGRAVVRLLERLGCEIEFPLEQTCCGQIHLNSGYPREGVALARRLARVFADAEVVVTPSASCAGMLRRQLPPEERPAGVRAFRVPRGPAGRGGCRRVLPAPGHASSDLPLAARASSSAIAPLRLLLRCAGSTWSSCRRQTSAAASAGRSPSRTPDVSTAMLTDKVRAILDTGAEVVCAADNSCLMQIGGALSRQRTGRPHRCTSRRCSRRELPGPPRAVTFARLAAAPQPEAMATANDPRRSAPRVVAELPDWEELRAAGRAIKDRALARARPRSAPARGRGDCRPAGRCTGRATATRPTASSAAIALATASARS